MGDVGDLPTQNLSCRGGEFVIGPRDIAGELVDLTQVSVIHEHGGCRFGVVATARAGHTTVTDCRGDDARVCRAEQVLCVVLVVPVVAQDDGRKPRGGDRLFCCPVLGAQRVVDGCRFRCTRVHELLDACLLGCLDDVAVASEAGSDLGTRDQQDARDAVEGGVDCGGLGVVQGSDAHTEVGERASLGGSADAGDDVGCRNTALEESVNDVAAEVARGARDENGHDESFRS